MDRRLLAVPFLLLAATFGAVSFAQEDIEALPGAHKQQEIEVLHPQVQQSVEAVDGAAVQDVQKAEALTPTQRTASAASKFAVAVLGLAVGLAASAASLIFL